MLNILEVVTSDKHLKSFLFSVKAAGLGAQLVKTGPFTLFAPTEIAFGNLHEGEVNNWLKPGNKLFLAELLRNHILEGITGMENFMNGQKLKTINGKELGVRMSGGTVSINDAVVKEQVNASNGVVYRVNKIITSLPASQAIGRLV